MSNPMAKKERSKAKDARQIPAPDTQRKKGKNKRPRPWVIELSWAILAILSPKEYKHFSETWDPWRKDRKYRTEQEARAVMDLHRHRNYGYCRYRLKNPEGEVVDTFVPTNKKEK